MSEYESSASEQVHSVQLRIPKTRKYERKKCICSVCKKEMKGKSSLYRHMREIHKEEPPLTRNTQLICPEPTCALAFHNRKVLRNHIQECHGVNIEFCLKKFPTFNDFQVWKENVEKETNSCYSVMHANRYVKGRRLCYYGCHRSGIFISKSTGKRKPKPSDSKKINGWCPAAMNVIVTEEEVEVKFWKTHFGHTCEVGHLILTHQEKIEIANKLKQGVGFQKILDEVRDSVLENDVRRIHLLNKRDLYNICRSFKISNKENSLQKEDPDINTWIENMRSLGDECPIIFYKAKGVDELTLKSPEFFLVIMMKLQQKMLLCCDSTIICIDCIYHIHTFSYYLITLMTVDVYNSGCPLAFCVTNRLNRRTISSFYNSVKSTVGTISANLFMSVDKPLFYSEWQNIMGPTTNQLLCNWDIDKSWRQKLEKLSISLETKVRVYKKMRLIMQEAQYGEFHSMLEDTLSQFENDDNLKEFVTYFRSKYLGTVELWANCYRSDSILHSNSILEQIHRDLHHCYMEGQSISSIVRVLNLVMEISRDKISEKFEKLPRELKLELIQNNSIIPKNQEIEKQKKCQKVVKTVTCFASTKEATVIKTKEVTEKQSVPTTEEKCYYVNHDTERMCPPDCNPICSKCCICFHKFTCTCISFQNLNICQHIHASVNVLKDRCTHVTKQCEINKNDEMASVQNFTQERIVEMPEEMDTSDDSLRSVEQIVLTEEETEEATDMEEVDIENFRSLLLQKVECFHHMLKNNTCKPEKYAIINEYFDKIIELF